MRWDCQDGAGDLVRVNGALVLPSVATVTVNRISGDPPATSTLFTANTLQGPGALDVSGWIVDGLAGYAVKIRGNSVMLVAGPRGAVMTLR